MESAPLVEEHALRAFKQHTARFLQLSTDHLAGRRWTLTRQSPHGVQPPSRQWFIPKGSQVPVHTCRRAARVRRAVSRGSRATCPVEVPGERSRISQHLFWVFESVTDGFANTHAAGAMSRRAAQMLAQLSRRLVVGSGDTALRVNGQTRQRVVDADTSEGLRSPPAMPWDETPWDRAIQCGYPAPESPRRTVKKCDAGPRASPRCDLPERRR